MRALSKALADEPELVSALKWGLTALYLAAGADADEVIPVLISHGAEIEWRRECDGQTALHNAVWHKKTAAAQALLQAGANPGVHCDKGNTPLHMSVRRSDAQLVRSLILAGADPNAANHLGDSSFDLAKQKNEPLILKLLESQA